MTKENKIMIAVVSAALMVVIAAIIIYRKKSAAKAEESVSEPPTPAATVQLTDEGKPAYLIGSKVRGIRNNNPGNIRLTSTPWRGKIPNAQNTDKGFEQFESYTYGVRAAIKQIMRYKTAYGIDTVAAFVARWAPAADNNNEAAYVQLILQNTGGTPTTKIDLTDKATVFKIANAVGRKENGVDAIPLAAFEQAWKIL
jgi:hypothetical protein